MKAAQSIKKDKLWTKYFILMIIFSFLSGTAMNMLNSPLPIYAKHIGGSNSIAGVITGICTLASLLCRPLWGKLLDSKGRKIVLVGGMLLFTLITFSYNFIYFIGALLIFRFIHGIGYSAQSTASGTIISDLIPKSRLVEGVGYYGVVNTITNAVGPALGLYFAGKSSYHTLFTVAALFAVAGILLSMVINYETEEKNQKKVGMNEKTLQQKKPVKGSLIEKTALPAALVTFFMVLSAGVIMTFLPEYAASHGIKDIGIYFTVNAAALLITRPFLGKLTERFGDTKVAVVGMIFSILSLLILSFATTLSLFLLSSALGGIGGGVSSPIINAIMIKVCPAERLGAANATYFCSLDIGVGLGAVAGGIVSQHMGFTFVFMASTACTVISLLLYILVLRKQQINHEKAVVGITTANL